MSLFLEAVNTVFSSSRLSTSRAVARSARQVERSLQWQIAARVTNIDGLGVLRNNPVLRSSVPVGQVPASDGRIESSVRSRLNRQTIEVSKDDLGIIWSTEADVELRNLISNHLASVLDGGGNREENVVQSLVSTWCATSTSCWHVRLRAAVV